MIRLQNIYKSFGKQSILENISLDIPTGSRFCILGGSGSGKSVLVKLILGLEEISQGEIYIDEAPVSQFSIEQWQDTLDNFGVVFQGSALFDSLDVLGNVGMKLWEERKESAEEIREKVIRALSAVNLSEDILSKYPAQLSGGMRKRVAIARAIIHRPRYLVYDEPTTGLDPVSAAKIDELIESLSEEAGRTSIIITHDMQSVRRLATDIVMLHEKGIVFQGDKDAFINSNQVEILAFLQRS